MTSRLGRKQSKHGDVADLSRVTSQVYGTKLGTKLQCERDEKCVNSKRKADSRQVRFSLVDALYFFMKLQSPKLHYYH